MPGLVAIAQSSNGSVANVDAIHSGALESGFAQSDIAHWAYTGTGIYQGQGKVENLRVIANLYPESFHIVAHDELHIRSVHDLVGKRVSLDEPGSGTLVDARIILEAFGVSEDDLTAHYLKQSQAIAMMDEDELDAFFIVAGYPTGSVLDFCATSACRPGADRGPRGRCVA